MKAISGERCATVAIEVWCEQFFGRYFFVIEEAIGGFEFCSSSECGGNASVGTIAKCFENLGESFVQSFVVEVGSFQFFCEPGCGQNGLDKNKLYPNYANRPRSKTCGV